MAMSGGVKGDEWTMSGGVKVTAPAGCFLLCPFEAWSNFVHPTLPVSFGRESKACWSLLHFYLMSVSGEVKYPTQGIGKSL